MLNVIKIIVCTIVLLPVVSCSSSKTAVSTADKTNNKDYSKYTNMLDVLSAVSGITVKTGPSGVEVSVRGSQSMTNTNEPLFVLNGVPVGRTFNSITHINPVQIKKIVVQRSLAATNRWGGEGNSGAILISLKDNK